MKVFDSRRPDDPPAPLPQAHAEIDIIVGDAERFVEASDLLKRLAPQPHAGRRHARKVLLQRGAPEISGAAARHLGMGVAGDPAFPEPEGHAGVLDGPVGIIQHGADRAHAIELQARDELFEPVGGHHLDIVVHQAED